MLKKLICLQFLFFCCLILARPVFAIYDPLSVKNNRLGVHLLSPDEIESASKLVNGDENKPGDWGYVTVPIQATDRDRNKWTRFMKKAKELKIIPIIRVATYADGPHWLEPNNNDLIDFANFLNELPWPIENRYVVIFNEVNRADEFGGSVSPENYADILSKAIQIFKSRSDKFFIINAALDNAAPNQGNFMSWDVYLKRMYNHNPDIFNQLDGWASHAYANPNFSASPLQSGHNKIDSFVYDLKLLNQFTKKKLPIFITEAGWSAYSLSEKTVASYYSQALQNSWANNQIVAITPFLLFADNEPFQQFSLLRTDHSPKLAYLAFQSFATIGEPLVSEDLPPESSKPELTFTKSSSQVLGSETTVSPLHFFDNLKSFVSRFFSNFIKSSPKNSDKFTHQVKVNDHEYQTEIVSAPSDLQIGLAKYQSIETNQAMLFQFPQSGRFGFWMKNMKFDIDIVWLYKNKVIGISRGNHLTPLETVFPPSTADAVLEVLPDSGIKIGDQVIID